MDPTSPRRRGSAWRAAAEFALAAVLSLALLAWLYELPGRDLRVPLAYSGDAFDSLLHAKLIIDHGWPLSAPDLGAPHGLSLHDYQQGCTLQHALMALLSAAVRDPFLLTNCYFLLTFPLAAVVCLAALRRMGLAFLPALAGSLLFAFLPAHHLRGITHLYLSGYFLVPVSALLAVWVFLEEPLFGRAPGVTWSRRLAVSGLALLVGSAQVYYAFFTCFLLLVAGLVVAARRRRWAAGYGAAALVGLVSASALLNLSPQLLYQARHGANPQVGTRSRWDAQNYDLRIIQLLLPTTGHRLEVVRRAKEKMSAQLVGVTEDDFASLGLLPSVGFLYLVGLAFVPPGGPARRTLHALAVLNLAALLLATKGGFGMMVAWLLPQIRCYNRLSVFLAFFAVAALAFLVDAALARSGRRLLATVGCLLIAALGAMDQTPKVRPADGAGFHADVGYVREIAAAVPAGGPVLQMPYQFFPEGHGGGHLRLSLHPNPLRWSFPAMRGRYPELYLRDVSRLPAAELVERLCWAGFVGVSWDRSLTPAIAQCGEADLQRVLGPPLVCHPQGRCAFYPLGEFVEGLRRRTTPAEAERLRFEALYPVLLRWKRGFQDDDDLRPKDGRWGNSTGELEFKNPGGRSRAVRFEMLVKSSPAGPGELRVHGFGADAVEAITEEPRWVRVDLELPPGIPVLRFNCSAPCHPKHARRHYCVLDYRLTTEGAGLPPSVARRK